MTYMVGLHVDKSKVTEDAHLAISAVIYAETHAFQRGDFESWKACWLQDERTQDVYFSATAGLTVQSGWPAIGAQMQNVLNSGIGCDMVRFGQENLRISLSRDTAWVVYDSWMTDSNDNKGESFETRILERVGDLWKIAYSSFIPKHNGGPVGNTLGLDQNGIVVMADPASLEVVKHHPIFTISAGRLRSHRVEWDKALQLAISKAAHHHGFFETHRFANEMGGPASYPVILGHTDEGGVAVAHLTIRDSVTYVRLDSDHLLDRRLNFAQAVFGLSEGQMRVARKIALGEGLKGLAENLGISVNTARTHLSRLYEKTGVNSQTALVRLLLSVG